MTENSDSILPESGSAGKIMRGALQIGGGAIPFAGGILGAIAGAWSERDQEKINKIIEEYLMRLKNESDEQKKTLAEIIASIDINNEKVRDRFESQDYQDLVKKVIRNWSNINSEDKRVLVRNLLSNAASTKLTSDDVVSLFVEWINKYSLLHFTVIGAIYNSNGITRGEIWRKIGKDSAREDSAEADLYKLLFRDLSTGGIIRQHRTTNSEGQFVMSRSQTRKAKNPYAPKTMTSAFDEEDKYELTALGEQFVHYAMNDITNKIGFQAA